MELVSDSIPNLIQGISQQPASIRSTSQLEAQENCYSSPVEGLITRSPTEHVVKVSDVPLDTALIHPINRTLTQRYQAIFSRGAVKVFDLTGVAKTVTAVADTTALLTAATVVITGASFEIVADPIETSMDFTVVGINTATVRLEFSVDGLVWTQASASSQVTSDGTVAGIIIGTNLFVRVVVPAYTSGTITASVTYRNLRYLVTAAPKTDFRAITIQDYTFLVNTRTTPRMSAALSPIRAEEGMVFVKSGQYGSKYEVFVDEVSRASYTTSTTDVTTLTTTFIALQLYNALVAWAGAGFTFTLIESVIWITKSSGTFKLRTQDGQAGTSLQVFKGVTTKFTNLPASAPNGFVIAIDANPDTAQGQYFVTAHVTQANVAFGPVTWQESMAQGIPITIDPKTMPYALIRNPDDTFTYRANTWNNRLVGDTTTCLTPSFIGVPITAVSFYKNRLVFLADENFILSETGQFFNFFRTSVTLIKDSDPVDSHATDIKVSSLKHAIPFNKSLILFSDQTQFEIPSDAAMTPKTVRCDVVAGFESLTAVKPANAGKVIQFLFDRETYVGVKELFVSRSYLISMDAEEVSSHVASYIPTGAFSLSVSTLDGLSVILTTGDPGSIYCYKGTWKDEAKLQSAWFRWKLNDFTTLECTVLSCNFVGSAIYLLMQRDGKVYLEKIRLLPNRTDPFSTFVTTLDRRLTDADLISRVYDSPSNTTTLTLPYSITSTKMCVVTRSVVDNTGFAPIGKQLQISTAVIGTSVITVMGDYSVNPLWIGQRLYAQASLSTIFVRQKPSGNIDPQGILQLTKGQFVYSKSGPFIVTVTPTGRTASDYAFSGLAVGDIGSLLGSVSRPSGKFRFSILSNNERVTISLHSEAFLPFHITSMEWEGTYTKRSVGR